jgi:hypothetical protein
MTDFSPDNFEGLLDNLNWVMQQFINERTEEADAKKVGLDPRAAYRLYVGDDCIIVKRSEDGTLQYYGGFEYIDKHLRHAIGDFVVYQQDPDAKYDDDIECRVSRCLYHFTKNKELKENEESNNG